MSEEVRVADLQCWNMSISFLFGKTPKVTMKCGNCCYVWAQRFSPIDFRGGHPRSMCPSCKTINYVPISVT